MRSWNTIQVGRWARSHEATGRGTFWSSKSVSCSPTRVDLLLVDNSACVLESSGDVLASQLGVSFLHPLEIVAGPKHAEDIRHQDARAADDGLAAAHRRVDADSLQQPVRLP